MEKAFVIIKEKYNHMNFDLPSGFNTILGINLSNCLLGLVTLDQFTIISGCVGLVMNLIFHCVKMYMLVTGRKLPENVQAYEPTATTTLTADIDGAPFERRCTNCAKPFEPIDPDQIFCDAECKDDYLVTLKNRKPYPNAQ
jgi:hypothetical protein